MKKRPAQIELPTPPDGYRFNFKVAALFEYPYMALEKKGWLRWREVDALKINPLPNQSITRGHAIRAAHELLNRYERRLQDDADISKLYSELHVD